MTWLYILAGIALLIIIILFIPISVKARYNGQLYLTLFIGFVRLRLIPKKKKKPKKAKKAKENKPEKEKTKKQKKNISEIIDIIKRIADLAENALKDFFRHIIIKKMMISISIAGNDAADTAIQYGYCCSAVYPAVGIIARCTKCKSYGVDISPDFDETAKSRCDIDFEARIVFFHLAALAIKHGIKGLRLLLDLK